MDISANIRAKEFAEAKHGLRRAYLDPQSPEEMAKRLQRARYLNVPVGALDGVSPEAMAQHEAEAVDMAALQERAPLLSRKLSDVHFAKLVQDDITNTGLVEELVWKLAPDHGKKPTDLWSTLRNSGARGAYAIATNLPGFGSVDQALHYKDELAAIEATERDIAAGKSDSELFGNEQDPTGALGRRLFENTKEKEKAAIIQNIEQEAQSMVWANRMRDFFQQSEVMERYAKTTTLKDAVSVVLQNPLEFLANVGPENLTQMAPAIPFMALFGASLPGMAATGVSSAGFDRTAQIMEGLSEIGVDLQEPQSIVDAFTNPAKRALLEEKIKDANAHAAATGLFDAASFGLAGKTLLPKKWAEGLSPARKNFANTLVQAPVQGFMGAAGEAAGQVVSKGQVESWADVVAEFAGEFFTAPVEVLSAGIKATNWAQVREQKAAQNLESSKQLKEAIVNSKLLERDPETMKESLAEISKQVGVDKVYINPEALQQAGLAERVRALSPTVNEQFDQALETGSEIAIPFEEYYMQIAVNDPDDAIAVLTGHGDVPSYNQAKEDSEAIQKTIAKQARDTLKANNREHRNSLAEVSQLIKADLKAMPSVLPEEARNVRAIITATVDALSRDMGILPTEAWSRYGARILGEPDVQRLPDGSIVVKSKAVEADGQGQDNNGTYFPSLKLIARWKGADRSTLLHEAAHMFLEMRLNAMRDLMAIEGDLTSSQRRVIEVGQDILDWAGVKDFDAWQALSKDERTKLHEKWARSFEAYVMEGQAPAKKLQKAFEAFKNWLTDCYKVIAGIPGQALDDTTRELFDNLFLTNNQIQESYARQSALSLLTAEELGLTPEEYAEYQKAAQDMNDQAMAEQQIRNGRIGARIRAQRTRMLADLKKQATGRLQEIRDEIEAETKKTTSWQTWNLFKNGGDEREGNPKLRISDLVEMGYDEKAIDTLVKAGLAQKQPRDQKMSLQALSDGLGYANVVEMVDDLLANYDIEAQMDKKAVDQLIAEEPMFANEKAMEEAIDASWYNSARTTVLSAELRALERMLGRQTKDEAPWFRSLAHSMIGRVRLDELKPNVYMRNAVRAAKNAQKAYVEGNLQACINYKRQELFQSAMAQAAKEARIERTKIRELAKKFTGKKVTKALDPDYLTLMQRIFIKIGYGDEKQLGLNPTDVSIKDQVRALDASSGIPIEIDDAFLDALNNRPGEVFSTVEGMRRVHDLLTQVNHIGRGVQHVTIENKKADFQETVTKLTQGVLDNAEAHNLKKLDNREAPGDRSMVKDFLKRCGFAHTRIPSLLACVEGKRFGEFFKAIVEPMDRCGDKAEALKRKYAVRLDKAFKPIMSQLKAAEKKTYKSVGVALTKMQVFAIALNTGNEGNMARLLQLPKTVGVESLTQEQVVALMTEALTAEELAVVQEVWDVYEAMRQESAKVAKRLTGREPLWVAPTPRTILSADGQEVELRGGYYPITYDKDASESGSRADEVTNAEDMAKLRNMSRVFDGHTKNRMQTVNKDFVLSLTLRGAFEGLDRQIHYVAWAEWVNNTQRIMRAVNPTILDYFGPQATRAIREWIEDVRSGGRKNETQFDAFFTALRRNISLAGIGLNFVTAGLQVLGVTQSIAVVGPKWMIKGVAEFTKGPLAAHKYVCSKSVMMHNRSLTQFRELAEVQAEVMGTSSAFKRVVTDAAYKPISWMQMTVDVPTWIAAYNKALSEGHTDQMAVAIADRSVIDAQGSGRLQDLSGVERGTVAQKMLTVFYTFFNTALNIAWVSKKTKKPVEWAADLSMILVMQPVMEATVRAVLDSVKEDEELDEVWADELMGKLPNEVLKFGLGLFAGARELQWVFDEYKNYSGPGGYRKLEDIGKAMDKLRGVVTGEGEMDAAFWKAINNAAGLTFGYPSGFLNRSVEGAKALYEDETDNPLVLILGYNPN